MVDREKRRQIEMQTGQGLEGPAGEDYEAFSAQCSGFRVPGSGVRGPGSGFRVPGSGVRGPGSGVRGPPHFS
ncbi:hypothetical protein GCM10029992_67070 [Glycomyces albus]